MPLTANIEYTESSDTLRIQLPCEKLPGQHSPSIRLKSDCSPSDLLETSQFLDTAHCDHLHSRTHGDQAAPVCSHDCATTKHKWYEQIKEGRHRRYSHRGYCVWARTRGHRVCLCGGTWKTIPAGYGVLAVGSKDHETVI